MASRWAKKFPWGLLVFISPIFTILAFDLKASDSSILLFLNEGLCHPQYNATSADLIPCNFSQFLARFFSPMAFAVMVLLSYGTWLFWGAIHFAWKKKNGLTKTKWYQWLAVWLSPLIFFGISFLAALLLNFAGITK